MRPDLRRALEKLALTVEPVGPLIRSYRGGRLTANSVVNWLVARFEGCSSHSGRRSFITLAAATFIVRAAACAMCNCSLTNMGAAEVGYVRVAATGR